MPVLRRRLRALRERVVTEDAGTTLTELLVGMLVMVIFMTIFTGAVVSMSGTVVKVDAVTSSAAQVDNAFLTLDKLVRYASGITTTGQGPGGGWYVELDTVDTAASRDTCTQLWVDFTTKRLRMRSWDAGSTAPIPSEWKTLADNIQATDTSGASYQPFTDSAVGASVPAATRFQQLTVTLTAGTDKASSASTTRGSITFTALNSSASDPTNATRCHQLAAAAYRP